MWPVAKQLKQQPTRSAGTQRTAGGDRASGGDHGGDREGRRLRFTSYPSSTSTEGPDLLTSTMNPSGGGGGGGGESRQTRGGDLRRVPSARVRRNTWWEATGAASRGPPLDEASEEPVTYQKFE
jgi:hypothetical protein